MCACRVSEPVCHRSVLRCDDRTIAAAGCEAGVGCCGPLQGDLNMLRCAAIAAAGCVAGVGAVAYVGVGCEGGCAGGGGAPRDLSLCTAAYKHAMME